MNKPQAARTTTPVRRRRKKKPKFRIPAWVFLLFCVVWDELLLHFMSMGVDKFPLVTPSFTRFLVILFFALSFGMFLAFFTSFNIPSKVLRIIALVLASLLAAFYLIEYFTFESYPNFMKLSDMTAAGGDVVTDFGGVIVKVIVGGFWRILLMFAPIVAYGIFGHKFNWGKARNGALMVLLPLGCLLFFGLGRLFVLFSPDSKKYTKQYTYNEAVCAFGLVTGVRLDLTGADQRATAGGFNNVELMTDATPDTQATQKPVDPDVTQSTGETGETPEVTEAPKVYGYHDMGYDFSALASSTSGDISEVNSYLAMQPRIHENEYTGLFKGKNLVLITAEAFCKEAVDPNITPTLYRMMTKGIYFTDFYQPAWGGSTSTGEYSVMTGLVPTDGVDSIQKTIGHNMYFTIGNQLRREGYFSAAYHNNTYTYYDRHKTHTNLGYDTFMGLGNGMENGVTKQWPESDLEMIAYTVPLYIDKQPFSVYYMTVSGHCLYNKMGNNMSKKNYDDPSLTGLTCSETVRCYYAANIELDKAMESLIRRLENAGIADDTVIVLTGDHYPYGLEAGTAWGNDKDYLAELYGYSASDCFKRDHSALLIWSGCIEDKNIVVDAPTYSLDIQPTLSNLFGVKYDARMFAGRDVFSEQMPLVIWTTYSWMTDKGRYDAATGKFTPNEGVTVPDGYEDTVESIVRNKIYFSRVVLRKDYYESLPGTG